MWSLVSEFRKAVKLHSSKIFMHMNDDSTSVTYKEADQKSNQVANFAQSELNLKQKNCIALFMPSHLDYVLLWLGFAKLGVTSGLINNNIKGLPLVHAITLALEKNTQENKIVIVSEVLIGRINDDPVVRKALKESNIRIISYEKELQSMIDRASSDPIAARTINWNDDLFFIYTSGTTGLPKAVKINHLRFFAAGKMMASLCHLSSEDSLYCALPLYHSAGGMVAVSACVLSGAKLVIRTKFSASNLLEDLNKHKCTVLQYIGEFARFALEAKGKNPAAEANKTKTSLRVAFGNGLRPELCAPFREGFDIDHIIEFYGSTEGNANLVNNTGRDGAIGVVPRLLSFIYPVCLVKCDQETGEIIRGEDGLAVMAGINEPGQLCGLINKNDPSRRFDGYTDAKATSKKICFDVKKKGDSWFLSGDLLRSDWFGFYYWCDRIGDTFRWRGENVSTSEVEGVINSFLRVEDECVVYGVEIPKNEGKAGMAKIVFNRGRGGKGFDVEQELEELFGFVERNLPKYMWPVFLRVAVGVGGAGAEGREDKEENNTMTGTFKTKKGDLRKQGFDVEQISEHGEGERVFFRDDERKSYKELTSDLAGKIRRAEIRL